MFWIEKLYDECGTAYNKITNSSIGREVTNHVLLHCKPLDDLNLKHKAKTSIGDGLEV